MSSHGYDFLVLERQVYTKILYDRVPEKSKILTGARVVDIVENEKSVKAYLDDGTCEEGDIIVGCDGVHSVVRSFMWDNANKISPGAVSAAEKRC